MSPAPATPLPRKLGLTGEIVFTVRHAPPGFAAMLDAQGGTGDAIWQQSMLAPIDVVIAFHTRRETLTAELPKLTAPLAPDGAVWVAWPSPASDEARRTGSDLDDATVRSIVGSSGFDAVKACTIDDDWTAVRFERRRRQLRPKDAARARRGR